MKFLDEQSNKIKDGNTLLFSHEDKVEPSGFNKYVTEVKLCFYSDIEKRYIPLNEISSDFEEQHKKVTDAEIIKDQRKKK